MIKQVNVVPKQILYTKSKECKIEENSLLSAVLSNIWPEEIVNLVNDLKDTAASSGDSCVGLSSNQIWDKDTAPPAVFVVKIQNEWKEFINPKIHTSGKTIKLPEACMSAPGVTKTMKRELNVTVTFQTLDDVSPQTKKFFMKNDIVSIIIQHEYDHLQGKVIG